MRFPNLPLVVGVWLVAFSRSAKGRVVVVDPVPGWLEVLLRDVRGYNGPKGGTETVFVEVLMVVNFVACFGLFMFELDRFALLFHRFFPWIWHMDFGGPSFWRGLGVCSGGS